MANPSPSNSGNPSASSLRELREAIRKLSVTGYTFPPSSFFPRLRYPAFSTSPFNPSKKPDIHNVLHCESSNPTSFSSTFSLDEKLQHLKASALSLKQRQDTDRKRLLDLLKYQQPFIGELREDWVKFVELVVRRRNEYQRGLTTDLPHTCKKIEKEVDSLIPRQVRLDEMAVEIIQSAEVMTNSRLTSLYEIVKKLAEIRKDLKQEEVWNELNERLMRVKEMEIKDFQLLAEETNRQLVYFRSLINQKIRHNY